MKSELIREGFPVETSVKIVGIYRPILINTICATSGNYTSLYALKSTFPDGGSTFLTTLAGTPTHTAAKKTDQCLLLARNRRRHCLPV